LVDVTAPIDDLNYSNNRIPNKEWSIVNYDVEENSSSSASGDV
jgi:hypothetical protein